MTILFHSSRTSLILSIELYPQQAETAAILYYILYSSLVQRNKITSVASEKETLYSFN